MRTSRIVAVGAAGIAAALALSACSSGGNDAGTNGGDNDSSSKGSIEAPDGAGKTLTVWNMTGDLQDDTMDAINKQFKEDTGADVKVETQQWKDIATKITTALATDTPPDVVEIGNTQVSTFAASGGLADLTDYKDAFAQGQTWLDGLLNPALVDNKLYAVPAFAATRTAIYNKKIWKDAGITDAPTSYDELKADLDKIKAKNDSSDFSAFYLPGQYWYAGLQWIWDAGGEIATQQDGKWVSGFGSDESVKGLTQWKEFQNAYSSVASRTLNTDKPDQDQVFADGKAATIIGNNWEIDAISTANPKLTTDDIGSFAVPGASGDTQPVMLAGSDWGIAVKSQQQELARYWVKLATGPEIQNDWVFGNDGWVPNSTEGIEKALDSGDIAANKQSFFEAAKNSNATPASGNWAQLEDPGIKQFFQSIASGKKSPEDAAKDWDATVNETLNK